MNEVKKALLVGINRYNDPKLNSLRFSVNDVTEIHEILIEPHRGGFAPDNCLLMVDKSEKASLRPTRNNLMSAIKSLSETATTNDDVFFFFSGHGIEEEGKSYLLPSDARINVLRESAVPIDWIRTNLSTSKARSKILIFDACHAGAMKGKTETGRMTKGLHDALLSPAEGFAILSSCKLNEVSYEMPEMKHSVFSYFLIEGLKGSADYDSDGCITVSDASRYTAEKTTQWSFKEGVQQTPNLEYHVVGDLILVNVPSSKEEAPKIEVGEQKKIEQTYDYLDLPISRIRLNFPHVSDRDAKDTDFHTPLCTELLQFFNLNEIEYDSKKEKVSFPIGGFDKYGINVAYSIKSVSIIEKILLKAFETLGGTSVVYYSPNSFDAKKIGEWVKSKGLKTLKYDPKAFSVPELARRRSFLEVLVDLPESGQKLYMEFINIPDMRENFKTAFLLRVYSEKEKDVLKSLDIKTFSKLIPTELLKFVGDFWIA